MRIEHSLNSYNKYTVQQTISVLGTYWKIEAPNIESWLKENKKKEEIRIVYGFSAN